VHIPSPTRAEISLGAISHNVGLLRQLSGKATIMAVVKADAYGHGAPRVARHLEKLGIENFAVATIQEAVELREAGVGGRMLVFAPPLAAEITLIETFGLDVSLTSLDQIEMVRRSGFGGRVHLKVDTGMRRVGIRTEEIALALKAARSLNLTAIWTHLATADDESSGMVRDQLEQFDAGIAAYRDEVEFVHVANSGALLNHRDNLELGDRTMVRPGITIYGLSPSPDVDQAARAGLRPAMRVVSRVSHMQTVHEGESVSYSRRWYAQSETRVATVQAGYADGVPRALTNKGTAGIGGAVHPIVGTVCMDAFMVDLGPDGKADVGDEAILFGPGGPSCFDVARAAGTITYEIACRVSPRVIRLYDEGDG
jgi:alanine racemase